MKLDLANCINGIKGKAKRCVLQEMHSNAVEMIARAKAGDLASLDEFVNLYCMNDAVANWKKEGGE